jgi:thiosulfate dehydrogenase [quinone] large subunit
VNQTPPATLAASIIFGAARVALGALWLHEGYVKYHAHFGRADILLVADGANSNNRIPDYFTVFANLALHGAPGVFGFLVPLLETTLGIALILGILTLPATLASLLNLMTYWSSDQLITQYPIMGALSAIVIAWPLYATQLSTTALLLRRLDDDKRSTRFINGPLRRWL